MQRREEDNRYVEKLVAVNRVSKTVKGGRNMRFSALMVVGDTENPGSVGCGMGKAVEIPEAIRKGLEEAKKSMVTIPLNGTTIPHEVTGVFGTGRVKMLPAPEGTGVIAMRFARSAMSAFAKRSAGRPNVPGCAFSAATSTSTPRSLTMWRATPWSQPAR